MYTKIHHKSEANKGHFDHTTGHQNLLIIMLLHIDYLNRSFFLTCAIEMQKHTFKILSQGKFAGTLEWVSAESVVLMMSLLTSMTFPSSSSLAEAMIVLALDNT